MIWPSSGWRDIFETFRYQYAHKMFCMHFIISATTTLYGLVWGDCTSHHYDANYNPLPQDGDIQYFMVHELYYTGGRDDVRKKVILTVEGIAEVLKHYHSNPMGGTQWCKCYPRQGISFASLEWNERRYPRICKLLSQIKF